MSETFLKKQWNWFLSEARTRLKPKGIEVVTMTRWSVNDLYGRLKRRHDKGQEQWREIRLPFLCDSENDPLNRDLGEMLWPEWYNQQMLKDAQSNPLIFQTLYQQSPPDHEGAWVPAHHFHVIDEEDMPPREKLRILIAIDIALSTTTKNDYSVALVAGVADDGQLYFIDMIRQREDPNAFMASVLRMVKENKPVYTLIDFDNASRVWAEMINREARLTATPLNLQPLRHMNKSKQERASPLRSALLQDRAFFLRGEWTQAAIAELVGFPAVDHDDVLDCASLVARMALRMGNVTREAEPATHDIEPQIISVDGKQYLNASLDDMHSDRQEGGYSFQRLR